MSIARPTQRSYVWLDVARAAAAAIVLGGHLRAYLFNDSVASAHLGAGWKAFYFVTSLQHQAVIVFFVLSGFLISKTVSEQARTGRWSWRSYAVKRLSRLWIVLLPALILTLVWDQLGMRFTGSALYTGGLNAINHSTPIAPLSFAPATFVGNVFFLQSVRVLPFGTDTPLWSLANEFWYYVVFPLFFFAFVGTETLPKRVSLLAAAVAICWWLIPAQCTLGLVWLLGYAAYLVERYFAELPRPFRIGYAIVTALLFFLVLILSKTIKIDDVIQDDITGVAFAVLLVPLCTLDAGSLVTRPAKLFAGFSYTLYVAHFPFLAFMTSALLGNARVAPSGRGLVTFAALFAVTMAYAYLVSLAFERKTPALQAWLLRNVAPLQFARRSTKIALRTE